MVHSTDKIHIAFSSTVYAIDDTLLVRLPEVESKKLHSRGQVSVVGSIEGHEFQTVVEPDGVFGHWIRIDDDMQRRAKVGDGDQVNITITPVKEWPEPVVPADLGKALDGAPGEIQQLWNDITPMARWEWVRWVNETRNADTRAKRIAVTISKMENGKRRPCCFNLAGCTDPAVSRSGKLRGVK